jgi:hypothetical protein
MKELPKIYGIEISELAAVIHQEVVLTNADDWVIRKLPDGFCQG